MTTILRQRSRPYLFSNALPPAVVAAASAAFDVLMQSTELRDQLQENTRHFRDAMTKAGFTIKGKDHPIVPIMLGDARLAAEFAEDMLKRDIYVIGFSYPVVPHGTADDSAHRHGARGEADASGPPFRVCARAGRAGQARIRVQLSAAHTREQIDRAIQAFIEVGRARKVIP